MKAIIRYQANDGTIFEHLEDCLAHESLVAELELIMVRLEPRPETFKNPETDFIQQKTVFYFVREDLLKIALRFTDHKWIKEAIQNRSVHPSYPGRIIDEVNRPLSLAWWRIMCTDRYCREWQQPYYANLVK